MKSITPFLWFDSHAEDAANYYVSIFPNSKIHHVSRYDEAGAKVSGKPAGSAMTVALTINGTEFTLINGGPQYKFSEAISFVVNCETQEEIDHLWTSLTANGGEEIQCGWLKDKYGLSWQIVPANLGEILGTTDPAKAGRAMQAMLGMKKLDIKALEYA